MTAATLRQLGTSDVRVSRVCLGAMTFGQPGWGCDEREARAIVDCYLDHGGNFIDTADIYVGGASEEIVGRALRGRRDRVVVATKVGGRTGPGDDGEGASRAHITTAVEASLRRLGTDHIDLYQLHHNDHSTPIESTLEVLHELVAAGKVRTIGCSNFFAWEVVDADARARARGLTPFASCQMMYNLVRRDLEREHMAMALARDVALITYSPLHSGILTGAVERDVPPPPDARIAAHPLVHATYLGDEERAWRAVASVREAATAANRTMSEIALGWVFRQPSITSVIIGARSLAELQANLGAADLDVDADIWDAVDRATEPPITYPDDFYRRLALRGEMRD